MTMRPTAIVWSGPKVSNLARQLGNQFSHQFSG